MHYNNNSNVSVHVHDFVTSIMRNLTLHNYVALYRSLRSMSGTTPSVGNYHVQPDPLQLTRYLTFVDDEIAEEGFELLKTQPLCTRISTMDRGSQV